MRGKTVTRRDSPKAASVSPLAGPLLPMTPHYIFLADPRHHLGESSEGRIEIARRGFGEGVLV